MAVKEKRKQGADEEKHQTCGDESAKKLSGLLGQAASFRERSQESTGHDSATTARRFVSYGGVTCLLAVKERHCYLGVMPEISHLECSRCHEKVSAEKPQTVCPKCAGAFYVRYDLSALHGPEKREQIAKDGAVAGWAGMWRYRSVLPEVWPVTLGEGWTPVIHSRRYPNAYLKEEGANPTGSFKARGLALAVTMARHYGLKKLAVPSAGNAAGALAAYAAAAGIEANIFMPKDVPFANYVEAEAVRSEGDAGRWADIRLREDGGGTERKRRLVRHLDAERAVSH